MERPAAITPDKSWHALLADLLKNPGAAMVIGTSDSGKSTLIKFLLNGILAEKKKACLVDADVGQTSLGVPGTITRKIFRRPKDLGNFTPDEMIFTGVTNPAMNFSGVLEGTRQMAEACRRKEIPHILIDTTGLVAGEVGKALKLAKIRLLKPRHVIAIEREGELEHILPYLKGIKVHRLAPSPLVKRRSPDKRSAYRERKFAEYFKGARVQKMDIRKLKFFYKEKEFEPDEDGIPQRALLGLNRNGRTLALGIYKGIERAMLVIKTPLEAPEKVRRIIVGDIVLE